MVALILSILFIYTHFLLSYVLGGVKNFESHLWRGYGCHAVAGNADICYDGEGQRGLS